MSDFAGRHVVVTGASSGIALATARMLARQGASRRSRSASTAAFLPFSQHGKVSMILKYYHAEPASNSLKSVIPPIKKGLPYQSIYIDLRKFEHHADRFVAIGTRCPRVLVWQHKISARPAVALPLAGDDSMAAGLNTGKGHAR